MTPEPPSLTHVLTIDFQTVRTDSAAHAEGDRFLLQVQSGAFQGTGPEQQFAGTVVHGADWVTRRAAGWLELDVRAELRADDGTPVLMTYTGVSIDGRVRTTPRFSAPVTSSLAWLNPLMCIAEGTAGPAGVRYEVWALA